jgi:hypothetical protein
MTSTSQLTSSDLDLRRHPWCPSPQPAPRVDSPVEAGAMRVSSLASAREGRTGECCSGAWVRVAFEGEKLEKPVLRLPAPLEGEAPMSQLPTPSTKRPRLGGVGSAL